MSNSKKGRYSPEFKESIISLGKNGKSANSLAREYGVSVSTIAKWLNQANPAHPELSDREKALIKENQRLKAENDILKQAAVLLAKD